MAGLDLPSRLGGRLKGDHGRIVIVRALLWLRNSSNQETRCVSSLAGAGKVRFRAFLCDLD